MSTLEIAKMLTLGTGHVESSARAWLDKHAYEYEFGWIVGLYHLDEMAEDMPTTVQMVLEFAREHDCQFVRLDSDGEMVDGLPWFDW